MCFNGFDVHSGERRWFTTTTPVNELTEIPKKSIQKNYDQLTTNTPGSSPGTPKKIDREHFYKKLNQEKDQKNELLIRKLNLAAGHIRQNNEDKSIPKIELTEVKDPFLEIPKLNLAGASTTLIPRAGLFSDIKPQVESGNKTPGSKRVVQFAQQTLKQIKKTAVKYLPKDLMTGEIRELSNEFHESDIFVIKVGEKYSFIKIGKKLGQGSFSSVYQIDETAGHVIEGFGDLVVKKLSVVRDTGEIDNEMEAAALKLPHVVLTYAAYKFQTNGKKHLILLQQSLKGGALEKLLLSENIPVKIKIEAIRQLAVCEKELQDNQIFHRDIKPGNAMLLRDVSGSECTCADVDVRVIDFGKYINMLKYKNPKDTLTWTGTLGYASPELFAIQHYKSSTETIGKLTTTHIGMEMARKMLYTDGKVDENRVKEFHQACEVYALSVSAYEVLFGVLPKMSQKILSYTPDQALGFFGLIETRDLNYTDEDKQILFQSSYELGIPDDLMDLIWRGFGPDPTERPSMNDFATYSLK